MERVTVWMARVGFLSIAACTFGLSFNAISEVARDSGAVDPDLAWIVPLAVDGMIVTATAVLWTESLSGRGWHLFPLASIIGPAALSMWANIAHASGRSLLAQVLAAVPPAGLILSLELVAWQIRRERHIHTPRERRRAVATAPVASRSNGGMDRRTVDPNGRDTYPETRPDDIDQAMPRQPVPSQEVHSPLTAPTRAAARKAVDSGALPTAPASRIDAPGEGERQRAGGWGSQAEGEREPAGAQGHGAVDEEPLGDPVHVDRDDDTGRITLDIPTENRGAEVWSRIIAAVQDSGAVPSQRELASELQVPRSSVRRAIERNRREWDELRQRIEEQPKASVGASSDDG